eukprot:TRINITY_DN1059_c0_g1_i1.p1 TRINITY_DN1059_c0_g1~~TRINITY_DN1059_c0_g1_i1.p1  ORF type:complete len:915 (-),score=287.01 TRINITY_DN1059_c0_g1_i1:63-2807(-)
MQAQINIPADMFELKPEPISLESVLKTAQPELKSIELYRRAANYIAGAQIFLHENVALESPLKPEHIKSRLLGHWGSCPGINLVYAHCNVVIKKYDLSMMLVTGPGHGAPANLANLYLEGTMERYFPECSIDREGMHMLIKAFSWPRGFASHLTAHIPGSIHEGGELGYCLSVAFGSVIDNPDLITTCIIGDGESETGPLAASWNSIKYLDPIKSGAVIPIIHLNGYKIASPTIYGSMSDYELRCLFTGLGYQVFIVDNMQEVDAEMYRAMDWAVKTIKQIQKQARDTANPPPNNVQWKWPMIIMRTIKGWTGIKELHGKKIEGTWRSHQVPAPNAKKDEEELSKVEAWLRSYNPRELFGQQGYPNNEILSFPPKGDKRMGMNLAWRGKKQCSTILRAVVDVMSQNKTGTGGGGNALVLDGGVAEDQKATATKAGAAWDALVLPDLNSVGDSVADPDQLRRTMASPMRCLGKFLAEVMRLNPNNFRIFSPDELASNKLDAVLEVSKRQFLGHTVPEDQTQVRGSGRVLEILSEHTLQGWLQGYLLTGRHGIFPSYEAFLGIVSTMMDQYCKFLKMSMEVDWRPEVPSLNYIASSTLWRQEHNGFSHQNPGFINTLINKKSTISRVYFPPDGNTMNYIMATCLSSKNKVNLIYGAKNETPQWLSVQEASEHCDRGASVWKWASTDNGENPDVVLVCIGVELTVEVIAAAELLRKDLPGLRVRVINVVDLMLFLGEDEHPHGWSDMHFDAVFSRDRPIIINFHGYPSAMKQLLFSRIGTIEHNGGRYKRFHIHGYMEEGTTTTPFDMCVTNQTSRYHIACHAIKYASSYNPSIEVSSVEVVTKYLRTLKDFSRYIVKYGADPFDTSRYWEEMTFDEKGDVTATSVKKESTFKSVADLVGKAGADLVGKAGAAIQGK